MQYTCPKCRAVGADNDKTYRAINYWCHNCPEKTTKMKPSHNGKILPEIEVQKHNNRVLKGG